ncbi:MAG: MCE family protein [Actinobacteria bacterium]|nr:MCE family protein [Actinomycetota bacterium]
MSARRVPFGVLGKVLAFTAVCMVFTVGLAVKLANMRLFADTYRVEAEFTNAAGIFKGDAVKLAGVDVGRVEGARIEDGLAVVTFNVDRDVRLSTESRVQIRWRNVLGQRYVYVFPGEGGRPLGEGDRIPVSNTDAAADLGAFLNRLGPVLRAIDPRKANAFIDAMNTALAGNEATVRLLIDDAASLADDLGGMDEAIRSVIASSDTVMATYAQQDESIATIITDLEHVGGRLEGMTDDVNILLTAFADVQEELDRLLRENRQNIDVSLADLRVVADTLARNRAALEETLCTLPAGIAPYFDTTSWGEWFNVRIVEFTLKDREGRTIAAVSELPSQRAQGMATPAYAGCDRWAAPTGELSGSLIGGVGLGGGLDGGLDDVTEGLDESTGGLSGAGGSTSGGGSGTGAGDHGSWSGGGDLGDLVDSVLGGGDG